MAYMPIFYLCHLRHANAARERQKDCDETANCCFFGAPCCPLRVLLHVNEGCKRVYWQGDRMPYAAVGIMLTVIGYIIRNLWGVEDESAGYVRGSFEVYN